MSTFQLDRLEAFYNQGLVALSTPDQQQMAQELESETRLNRPTNKGILQKLVLSTALEAC